MLAYKTVSGTKNYKKAMHLLIQLLAFCLSIIGFWAALKFHNDKGIDNFYSLHSWLGLACLVLFGIQVCFQILLFILYNFFFFYFFSFSIFFFGKEGFSHSSHKRYMHSIHCHQLLHLGYVFKSFPWITHVMQPRAALTSSCVQQEEPAIISIFWNPHWLFVHIEVKGAPTPYPLKKKVLCLGLVLGLAKLLTMAFFPNCLCNLILLF